MNRKQIAVIFLACAALLAVGAYILLSDSGEPGPVVRKSIDQGTPPPAKAPEWVDKGQTPSPDYSPTDTRAHNATPVPPKVPAAEPKVIEVKEDRVVTFTFVESLSDFFLGRFVPKSDHGKPVTLVTPIAVNMHYGRDLDGLATSGEDIRSMRKTVLDYVFTPTTIQALSNAYTPLFMDRIVDSALNDEREYSEAGVKTKRTLTATETAVMLRLNARVLERTANIFRALANDPELVNMAARYLQASKAVKRANGQLQDAIAEQGDTKRFGQRYKQAILQRESVRSAIVARMKKTCEGCPPSELFYITQWAYRRTLGDESGKMEAFTAAADALDRLSVRFLENSTELDED
jgi:hypothetical protein